MSDKYFQMIHVIGHLMNLCVLFSNEMVQKEHMSDPSPRLFKVEPNGSLPIMTLQMNTFARNGKWECQQHCNICHYLSFNLHTFHTFSILGDIQDYTIYF